MLLLLLPLTPTINGVFPFLSENNGLLFLETSALDSTNVELAFETVLKGQSPCLSLAPLFHPWAAVGMQTPNPHPS